uniref:Uncharacterized protein n=1 Tax=Strongyloides venezuelensis TaxID=75913 RepID=A0A0K0FZH2_STRVS
MLQIHEQVRKFCDRSQYRCATYDADRLMEYNFANDITNILESPSCVSLMSKQNLLFSSTFPPEPHQYFSE